MTLEDWRRTDWLAEQKPTPEGVRALLAVADRELADAGLAGLSVDARFGHAYSAALQSAAAALLAAGFRPSRGASHHHVVIQSLTRTLVVDARTVGKLDGFRKKRNTARYEMVGSVTELEADEMMALARRLRKDVESWLRKRYPRLL